MSAGSPRLADHLVVGLAGPRLDPAERAWLAAERPAGVVLFGRNVIDNKHLSELCAELHELAPGLEVCVDQEGGPVSVAAAAVGRPPAAATCGLLDDPDLTYRVHRSTGRRLAACGIDLVLGPVADVLTEPRNPVIGVRAFGRTAALVARHAAAAVAGLIDGGVAACVKHFPGHGGTDRDSHLGEAASDEQGPAEPFRQAVAAGAQAIMLAHVGPSGGRPATLDPAQAAAARALATGRPMRLYADDVTMGALRRPLAARGVAVPAGEGLIDPALLDAAWLRAMLDGGCDRLLVRGIPWAAYPDAPRGPAIGVGLGAPTADATAAPEPAPDPAWDEARRRLASLLPEAFADRKRILARIDRTADDRWGPLDRAEAGAGPAAGLAGLFGGLVDERGLDGCDRVLLTSHRPLEAAREAGWAGRLAPSGVGVGVGHPSLGVDLAELLPLGWKVAWLPEWP